MAFLKGAGWGLVVGGLAVATTSLIAPQPAGVQPPVVPQVRSPETAIAPQAEPTTAQSRPALMDTPADPVPDAPEMAAPTVEQDAPPSVTGPSDAPPVSVIEQRLADPGPTAPPGVEPAAETPVLPNPQSVAPSAPDPEADVVIQTEPPGPVVVLAPASEPARVVIDTPAQTPTVTTGTEAGETGGQGVEETILATSADPGAASADTDPDASAAVRPGDRVVVDTPVLSPGTTVSAAVATVPSPRTIDRVVIDLPSDSASDTTAEAGTRRAQTDPAPTDPARPAIPMQERAVTIVLPETPDVSARPPAAEATGSRAVQVDPQTGVTVRRPSLSTPQADPAPEQASETPDDAPALEVYGAFFGGAQGLPLMSIVVLDTGQLPDGPRALSDVPFAVTVALDPSSADATARMRAYRGAGFEVAAVSSLPAGGTDQDVAVALEGTFSAVPEAVALVALQDRGLGRSDPATARVAQALARDGRGLLATDAGLNGAVSVARGASVPALPIFRDLREVEQNPRTLRRFIDQAAFRARQQDGVVVVADLTPEVFSALVLWGTANRAGQVTLAPLSATLMADGN